MPSFSIYWTVAGVSHTRDYATRRNIKKAVLFPRYKGSVSSFDCVSAYVGSTEIDPPSALNVIRREDSLTANSAGAFESQLVWKGVNGVTTAGYFLLTDVVGEYISTDPEPFYWKHVLPDASIDPASVAILDKDLKEVDKYSYKAIRTEERDDADAIISGSYESCAVFSNYGNSYDEETDELEIYFVRYSASGASHYQLLSPQPAFSEATVEDISLVTGQLKTWRRVYKVTAGPAVFSVVTPSLSTTYYLLPLEESRIFAKEPPDRSDTSPWFLNVTNGKFSSVSDDVIYVYSIPEFSEQSFSPLFPYKIEVDEQALYIRPDIIKVSRSKLKVDTSMYAMDVIVKNSSGNVLYALTTEASKAGTYYEELGQRIYRTIETDNAWVTWDGSGIAGWDVEGGFVHLKKEYPDTRYFYVTYYYKETGLEYTSLNVNPIFDEGYDGQFYVLYVVPLGGDNPAGSTAALQYIKVDRSGRIIETSQDGSAGNLDLESLLTDESQYMYYSLEASSAGSEDNLAGQNHVKLWNIDDFPSSGILYWDDGTKHYEAYDRRVEGSGTPGVFTNGVLYFENHTLATTVPRSQVFKLLSFTDLYASLGTNAYQWLILAEVHSASTSRVDELSIIDLRMPGGVIKEKYRDAAAALDARAVWARPETIATRGQPIPGDSVAVVKVPYTLLKEYGGNFAKEEVESVIVDRHLAVGIVPAIIYDGAIPEISNISSTSNSVTVTWHSEGSGYQYNVYYSSIRSGPWTLATATPVGDEVYGNSYTITGLTAGLIYYVVVTAVSSGGIEGPKGTPWGIRTRTS